MVNDQNFTIKSKEHCHPPLTSCCSYRMASMDKPATSSLNTGVRAATLCNARHPCTPRKATHTIIIMIMTTLVTELLL